jgi:hypothetical protein
MNMNRLFLGFIAVVLFCVGLVSCTTTTINRADSAKKEVAVVDATFSASSAVSAAFEAFTPIESSAPSTSIFLGEQGGLYQTSPYGITHLNSGRYYQHYQNGYIDGQTGIYYQAVPGGYFFDTHQGSYVKWQ